MLPMRDDEQQLKIELLSQWKLEAESRNLIKLLKSCFLRSNQGEAGGKRPDFIL